MLEKGTNKAQKSCIFDSLDEAQHYQALYGGKISILRKQELTFIDEEDPLNFGLDNPRTMIRIVNEDIGNKYYILNICDQVDLMDLDISKSYYCKFIIIRCFQIISN